MQISITARGIDQFQSKFTAYEKKQSSIISSFSTVKSKTRNASGGVGNMQGALNSISARIKREETKKTAAQTIRKKADGFVERTRQTDRQVAEKVKQSSDAFYKKYPHLKSTNEDKPWYERIWDQLCKGVDAIKEGLKNLWDSAVKFYNKHKKIIDTILVVVLAVAAIVGVIVAGAFALVPLLGVLGFSAATAAAISTAVFWTAIISTSLAAVLDVIDIWAEVDHWAFNLIQTASNWISGITTLVMDIGGLFNSITGVFRSEIDTMVKFGFDADGIRRVVEQDYIIKKFSKALEKLDLKQIKKMSSKIKGNFGEMVQDKIMRIQGYDTLQPSLLLDLNEKLHKGIDGAYWNGDKFVIGDAKWDTAQLNNCKVGGKQMSFEWIEDRLPKLKLKDMTIDGVSIDSDMILQSDFVSQLTNVLPDGTVTISYLDDMANVVETLEPLKLKDLNRIELPKCLDDVLKNLNLKLPGTHSTLEIPLELDSIIFTPIQFRNKFAD